MDYAPPALRPFPAASSLNALAFCFFISIFSALLRAAHEGCGFHRCCINDARRTGPTSRISHLILLLALMLDFSTSLRACRRSLSFSAASSSFSRKYS